MEVKVKDGVTERNGDLGIVGSLNFKDCEANIRVPEVTCQRSCIMNNEKWLTVIQSN